MTYLPIHEQTTLSHSSERGLLGLRWGPLKSELRDQLVKRDLSDQRLRVDRLLVRYFLFVHLASPVSQFTSKRGECQTLMRFKKEGANDAFYLFH